MKRLSVGEETFALHVRAMKLPAPEREYRFHPARRWRFDFAWPGRMLAVEIEGGAYSNGRHTRGKGYTADMQKYNAAAMMGWCVLRFGTEAVQNGQAIDIVKRVLAQGRRTMQPNSDQKATGVANARGGCRL